MRAATSKISRDKEEPERETLIQCLLCRLIFNGNLSVFGKNFEIEIKVYLMEIMLLCVIANILDLGQEFQFEENVFQLSGEIAITKQVITSYIESFRLAEYNSVPYRYTA